MSWKHSGFSVHNGVRIAKDDAGGKENVAQYIIRNSFSIEKLTYIEDTGAVIYHSRMTHGSNKKNFVVYEAEDFIAAICQHIPEKFFQMVRYFGFYSNKCRGIRRKHGILRPGEVKPVDIDIIDISEYKPLRVPSKTWRECIKKIWEIDPLICPRCGGRMKIIAFIIEEKLIQHILVHLGLWKNKPSRDPPATVKNELVYEPVFEDWPIYEEPCFQVN